jgi:hypothetical protein
VFGWGGSRGASESPVEIFQLAIWGARFENPHVDVVLCRGGEDECTVVVLAGARNWDYGEGGRVPGWFFCRAIL